MISRFLFLLLGLSFASNLFAQENDPNTVGSAVSSIEIVEQTADVTVLDSGNTAWMLTATALVLFMTLPGLALFYAGLVQSKNVLSVLMHCFAIACLPRLFGLLWVTVYPLPPEVEIIGLGVILHSFCNTCLLIL